MVHRVLATLCALVLISSCANSASQSTTPSASSVGISEATRAATPSGSNPGAVPSASTSPVSTAEVVPSPAALQPDSSGLMLPPGFHAELYAQGLRNPTALAFGADHKLYVTQLNGGENDGAGQVVVIDQAGAAPRVVLEKLYKPTGLVWRENALFLVAGRDILQTSLADNDQMSQPVSIVHGLPFNTRSEGQIELLPDGRLLFEATGLVQDSQSGRLFTLTPGQQPQVLAIGLKNAYGHAVDPASGQIYTTEIGDDPMNGQAPPEEVNAVVANGDYGWPRCYANRLPATDHGGTEAICAATIPPIVTFPPHNTPTGLAFYNNSDFPAAYRNALYLALWNGSPPRVFRITLQGSGEQMQGTAEPFIDGMKQAIDLLPDPQGGLLALDFITGNVYRIVAQSS